MAYTDFTNCTANEYKEIIYSEDDKNRIRIWFNNVELLDADEYCEGFNGINRILPNDGSKRFTLENFVAKEYELALRDLPLNVVIEDQVKISIGTVVDEENDIYEDVPIGIFNIQNEPVSDNGRIILKLRDNRVKFDFYYNAKPLMDLNDGVATLGQILNDICTQAGVTNNVGNFNGMNIEVSIYDNSIYARTYVAYILGQAGLIPTIDRLGQLSKIDLTNLAIHKIPLDLIEKYELGTSYKIERVVYESGIIKYESSNDTSLSTLYLDSANPYITTQGQVDYIFNLLKNFEIDSVTTGRVLGNPAIDSYDLIQVYGYYEEDENGNQVFVDDDSVIVFTTLANNTYSYSGVHRNTFDTQIGLEERKENVSKTSKATQSKIAKTEIDNANGSINLITEELQIDEDGNSQVIDSIKATQTQNSLDIEAITSYEEIDGVRTLTGVKTSKGFTFNSQGLIIQSGENTYKAVHNETGEYYYDGEEILGTTNPDGSAFKNMDLYGEFRYGKENIDDEAMFVDILYTDEDGEVGVGTFYNGS